MTPLRPSGRYWTTVEDQPYTLTDDTEIIVPKGFVFDGHSIPLVLLSWVNQYSHDVYAALLHDYLYEKRLLPRRQADIEYLHYMKKLHTNILRRYTFYFGVRLFGWLFY